MNPSIEAALILLGLAAIATAGTAWLIFWISADIDRGWPKWATYPAAAAPIVIGLYACIFHAISP